MNTVFIPVDLILGKIEIMFYIRTNGVAFIEYFRIFFE